MAPALLLWLLCLEVASGQGDVVLERQLEDSGDADNAASLRRADDGCVDGDTNGEKNSVGKGCELYVDGSPKFICDVYNTPTFNATDLCCYCKDRDPPPVIPSNCRDTDHGALNPIGQACKFYNDIEDRGYEFCGHELASPHFNSSSMCCGCREDGQSGGYEGGALCPYHALRATPDSNGLCHCASGMTCSDLPTGDCPAQGSRSTSSFDVTCQTCLCWRRGEVTEMSRRLWDCGLQWRDTGLPETQNALTFVQIMNTILNQIIGYTSAVTAIRRLWLKHANHIILPNDQMFSFRRDLLRDWVNILFEVHELSAHELSTCDIIFPNGSAISLESGGCASPEELSFRSSVNENGYLEQYAVAGLRCRNAEYGFKECTPDALWLEGWSINQTKVLSKRSGTWTKDYQAYHPEDEDWWPIYEQNKHQRFLWFGAYTSHMFGESMLGLGQPLLNPHLGNIVGISRCQVFTERVSNFLGTLAGDSDQKLFFMQMVTGELLAASSGPVQEDVGLFKKPLKYMSSSDPILVQAGKVIQEREPAMLARYGITIGNGKLYWEYIANAAWPEMQMTLDIYVSSLSIPVWIVYVQPPRCLPGMFAREGNETSVNACEACPLGRKSERGMVIEELCDQCTPGSYADQPGSTICFTCQTGFYQDEYAATECKRCPNNTRSDPGAKTIGHCRCEKGFYNTTEALWPVQNVTSEGCLDCPEGSECNGGQDLPMAKSKYFLLAPSVSVRCVSTMNGNPCLGGDTTREGIVVPPPEPFHDQITNYCQEGYEGISCTYCSSGYFRFGRDCLECTMGESVLWVLWVLLLVVFYMLRRVVNSKYKTLYIFLSFLQVFGLQGSFPLDWSSRIKQTMRIVQVTNLQVDLLVPYCGGEKAIPFFNKYVGYLLLPGFFLLVDLIVIFVSRSIKWCRTTGKEVSARISHNNNSDPASTPLPRTPPAACTISVASGVSALTDGANKLREIGGINSRSRTDLVKDFIAQFLVNMRLMYLSLCGRTMDMVQCTSLGPPLEMSRLSKDMNYVCWHDTHLSYMPLVAFATLVYVLGTPLAYIIVLYRGYRSNLLYSPEHLKRYGLLYGRFEHDYFFWELVISVRRVSAVAIRTLLNIRTAENMANGYIGNYQAALVASLMVLALALHFWTRPFCNGFLDFGEACYLATTFFSCLIGLCFSSARNDEERNAFEVLFFTNLYFALVVTAVLLWVDAEVVHPQLRKVRKRVTDRLRVGSYYKDRLKESIYSTHRAEYEERITSLNYEQLSDNLVIYNTVKSMVSIAVSNHLSSLDMSIPDGNITGYVMRIEDDWDTCGTLIRATVKPPKGIQTEKLQEALDEAAKTGLVQSLLPSMSSLGVKSGDPSRDEKVQRV